MIAGPFKAPSFRTTNGSPHQITVHSALLDKSRKLAAMQPIAGGVNINVEISSSNDRVGGIAAPGVTIPSGEAIAAALFTPAGVGNTTLKWRCQNGFCRSRRICQCYCKTSNCRPWSHGRNQSWKRPRSGGDCASGPATSKGGSRLSSPAATVPNVCCPPAATNSALRPSN